jgi:hypothetical protein
MKVVSQKKTVVELLFYLYEMSSNPKSALKFCKGLVQELTRYDKCLSQHLCL